MDGEEDLADVSGQAGIEKSAVDVEMSEPGLLEDVLDEGKAFLREVRDVQEERTHGRGKLLCNCV